MKKKKYLPLYYKWMKTGYFKDHKERVGAGGLCNSVLFDDAMFHLFNDYGGYSGGYWGYDGDIFDSEFAAFDAHLVSRNITRKDAKYSFTPFRQTIVLLLAAMNNEL